MKESEITNSSTFLKQEKFKNLTTLVLISVFVIDSNNTLLH